MSGFFPKLTMLNNLDACNEKELITLFIDGDEVAFEKIYRLYCKRLLGNIIKLVKSEDLAAELLQEVFVKLWCNRHHIDPDRSFSSYLFRISQNQVCDFYRKAARNKKLQEAIIAGSIATYVHIEENFCNKEDIQYLHQLVESLPPRRRTIFQLIKMEGLSYEEVSMQLNISKATINDHIVKATKYILEQSTLHHAGVASLLAIFLLA